VKYVNFYGHLTKSKLVGLMPKTAPQIIMIKVRAAAIIKSGNKILLHKTPSDDFWALPGGSVELSETSAEAIRREIREELHEELADIRLSFVVENFFRHKGLDNHEIGFYYLTSFTPGSAINKVEGEIPGTEEKLRLVFRWFSPAELRSLPMRPSLLCDALLAEGKTVRHLVHHAN